MPAARRHGTRLRLRLAAFWLPALLLVPALPAPAQSPAAPNTAAVVYLTTGENYAPYSGRELPEGGLATDIVGQVFRELKQDTVIDWLPWARGFYETINGKYAATFPYVHSAERDRQFYYSDPLYEIRETIFARPGFIADTSAVDSLRGKVMCLPIGWAPAAKLEALVQANALTIERPKDSSSCMKMVAHRHADFFATDLNQGIETLVAAGIKLSEVTPLAPPLSATTLHLIASRAKPGSAALIAQFNAALATLKQDGRYDRIVAAHIPTDFPPK